MTPVREVHAGIDGHWRLIRRHRQTDRLIAMTPWKPNAITAAGKDLFLQLGVGASSDDLDSASDLVIKSSGGTIQKTLGACQSGYPKTSDEAGVNLKECIWRWADETSDTYSAYELEVKSPGGVLFSESNQNLGTKPSSENWYYEYKVLISASDSDFTDAGLDHWLKTLSGAAVDNQGSYWDAFSTDCECNASGSFVAGNLTSGPTVDTVNDRVTWVWRFGDGVALGSWGSATLRIRGRFTDYDVDLRSGGTGEGATKSNDDIWDFTYQFSIT